MLMCFSPPDSLGSVANMKFQGADYPFADSRLIVDKPGNATTPCVIAPATCHSQTRHPFAFAFSLEQSSIRLFRVFATPAPDQYLRQHGVLVNVNPTTLVCIHSIPELECGRLTRVNSSCIAHKTTILAECTTSASSQTSSLASLILPKIEHNTPQKLTYTHGQHQIHYVSEAPSEYPDHPAAGGLTFLVIADASLGRRVPFGYLLEIRKRFFQDFPESSDFAELPNYGAGSFNSELRNLMVEFGTTSGGRHDAIGNAQREIEDVRGIMTKNIESLLERGERLDLLVDKTDRLGGSAREFRVRSRGLKREMWWKNVKLMALLGLVVLLIILSIVITVKN